VEPRVWGFVSELLADPERLRAGLEEMITRKRQGLRGNPDREAKLWTDKLAEVDRKRARFKDMAAEGLIEFDDLRARLADLEETRETAQLELAALEGRREKLAELERDRDALMESYAGMVPEALETLSPEERHHVYKLLKLRVDLSADDTLKVSGALDAGATAVSKTEAAPASRCT
jgi:site-specific DNA recombinase